MRESLACTEAAAVELLACTGAAAVELLACKARQPVGGAEAAARTAAAAAAVHATDVRREVAIMRLMSSAAAVAGTYKTHRQFFFR